MFVFAEDSERTDGLCTIVKCIVVQNVWVKFSEFAPKERRDCERTTALCSVASTEAESERLNN